MNCEFRKKNGNGKSCTHYIPSDKQEPGFCRRPTQFICIEAMKSMAKQDIYPHISYSALQNFIRCKIKFYKANILGIEVRPEHKSEPLKLGTVWDKFIDNSYAGTFPMHGIGELIEEHQIPDYQAAKLSALFRAFKDLEIKTPREGLLGSQYEIWLKIGSNLVKGKVDLTYKDHICEAKLSGSPNFYTKQENTQSQGGTYLLANDDWEYIDYLITKIPQQRQGKETAKKKAESIADYEERIYGNILTSPKDYFLGWNKEKKVYGKRFWRSEYDFEYIQNVYRWVFMELKDTITRDSWYRNEMNCNSLGECEYMNIKQSGGVSERIYRYREVKENEKSI